MSINYTLIKHNYLTNTVSFYKGKAEMDRKNLKNTAVLLFCLLLMLNFLFIIECDASGTSSNAMLKIGVGAKPSSMGEASVALSNDLSGIYWNPAGLVQLRNSQLSAMHIEWFDDVRYEWLGFAQPISSKATIAVDISYLYMGAITRTIESLSEEYEEDGTFSPVDMAGRLAISVNIIKNLLLGASLQRIQSKVSFDNVTKERISDKTSQAIAIDLGGIYTVTKVPGLTVGGCLQNIGNQTKAFITDNDPLPFAFAMGSSYKVQMKTEKKLENNEKNQSGNEPQKEKSSPNTMTIVFDLYFPNDDSINVRTGVEYRFSNGISLRGGYRTGTGFDFPSGLSAGFGYDSSGYQVDYAFVPYGDLGGTHRVSFTIRF
ncbi:TPA: PorV/PorQ family protein [Candidatus Poribacteria bacterium]|nr:PorV/PorQ family protein [Candidatus Poribacteria bacterium]